MHAALSAASRPHPLLDALPAAAALERALADASPDHPRRVDALVRLAELLRAVMPERARAVAGEARSLGGDPARCAAVEAAASLEERQLDAATGALGDVPEGPVRRLLAARQDLLQGRRDAGVAALEELSRRAPVEVRAEALSFLARAAFRDGGAPAARPHLDALHRLATEAGAPLTVTFAEALRALLRDEVVSGAGRFAAASRLATLHAQARRAVPARAAEQLGPIPLELHGTLQLTRGDPEEATSRVAHLATLSAKLQRAEQAHRYAVLGERLIRRLHGDRWGDELLSVIAAVRDHVGPVRWVELDEALAAEESAWIGTR